MLKISSVKLPENVTPTITGRDFVIATVVAPTILVEPEKTEEVAAEGEVAPEGTGESVAEGATSAEATKDKSAKATDDKGKAAPADKSKAAQSDKSKAPIKETKKKIKK